MAKHKIDISYSQICIFHSNMENPFNDWTVQHIKQGFSWRAGSVSFKTLLDYGKVDVNISIVNRIQIDPLSTRIISVPLTVNEDNTLEIASITDSITLKIKPGLYIVVYETGYKDKDIWIKLSFQPTKEILPPEIVKDFFSWLET